MQLSPLQSRLAASLIATCLLIALYLTLFTPRLALAETILQEALPPILDDLDHDLELELDLQAALSQQHDPTYEPEFAAFDRSIIGRAPVGVMSLTNNVEMSLNVEPGSTQVFVFELSATAGEERNDIRELRRDTDNGDLPGDTLEEREEERGVERRQSGRTVYISANTCEQPQRKTRSNSDQGPPQLTLYVSTDPSNESPGPQADASTQVTFNFTEGAIMYNLTTERPVFIGVHASNASTEFQGGYNFRVAASTDTFFHSYSTEEDADLILVDTDSQGALLMTHNLTDSSDPVLHDRIMATQPYVMFAQNEKEGSINGVRQSYCGLQVYAQIAATKDGKSANMVKTAMTKRGPGKLPKQQFYFTGLNASADYIGILAQNGNLTNVGNGKPGGGGHVFRATAFTTKRDNGNCAIIQNLQFCDEVAYSVPSNPSFGDTEKLAEFYDSYASEVFENFKKVMAQVPCEAPNVQRYSLVRNCSDCNAAYKEWLCSVAIPRCEDFSNSTDTYHPRALSQPFPNGERLDAETLGKFPNLTAYNSSRNPRIDEVIRPGPYKEVLPCDDLCYALVQSCPSSLDFSCPRPGDAGFSSSYATRVPGQLSCNYQGSAHLVSGVGKMGQIGYISSWVAGLSLGASLVMAGVI
ncbi:hypothetical protein V8F06_002883 [Rhypophila decipiens]